MIGIITFQAEGGTISVEVDESTARTIQRSELGTEAGRLIAKGDAEEVIVSFPKSFGDAMSMIKVYVANLDKVISSLDPHPKEVYVEIGLKISGTAGFVIAKAGAETAMKLALTWEPKSNAGR